MVLENKEKKGTTFIFFQTLSSVRGISRDDTDSHSSSGAVC